MVRRIFQEIAVDQNGTNHGSIARSDPSAASPPLKKRRTHHGPRVNAVRFTAVQIDKTGETGSHESGR
jgi:hypothetical protein